MTIETINPLSDYLVVVVRSDGTIADVLDYGQEKDLFERELKEARKLAKIFGYEMYAMKRVGARV